MNRRHAAHPLLALIPLIVHPLVKASPINPLKAPDTEPGSPDFWWKLGVIVALVLTGGCFAGLTLGLMGLDMINLQVLSTAGTEKEQKQAKKVLNLLGKGRHWVLVVLLLSNVIVNESLPIFLDSVLGGGIWAVIISTSLIFVFGEIIPQSLCARYGLAIGAVSAPFVLTLMWIEAPIAWPLAKMLDFLLGEDEGTTYRKAELKQFVSLHRHLGEDHLNEDEVTIINAVLELNEKTIEQIMTPIEDLYTLSTDSVLDENTVMEILSQGYSRIPIHEPDRTDNFVGMLLAKKLITYDPEDAKKVFELQISPLPEAETSMTCLEALNYFQQGRSHMLLVSTNPGTDTGALGVVSLEDVIEEMIGEEIIDETDIYVDVHNRVRVVRRPAQPKAGNLAPLLKDAISRRRGFGWGSYGSVGGDSTDTPIRRSFSHPPTTSGGHSSGQQTPNSASMFQRVKVKGHESIPTRADLIRDYHNRRSMEITRDENEQDVEESSENEPLIRNGTNK